MADKKKRKYGSSVQVVSSRPVGKNENLSKTTARAGDSKAVAKKKVAEGKKVKKQQSDKATNLGEKKSKKFKTQAGFSKFTTANISTDIKKPKIGRLGGSGTKRTAEGTLRTKKQQEDYDKAGKTLKAIKEKRGAHAVGVSKAKGLSNAEHAKIKKAGEEKRAADSKAAKTPKADAVKDTPKVPEQQYKQSRGDKRRLKRQARKDARAAKAQSKYDASQKNKSAYTAKQAERLKKRAEKKKGIAAGTRKTGLGTALTKLGRGTWATLAAAGGEVSGFTKGGTKGSPWKTAAHAKKQKKK